MSRIAPGVRVLRGPNWEGGGIDGGEGHLGTLIELQGPGLVRVLWDNGQESSHKAGAGGKYELRIFDTAPIGIRHMGTICAGCDEQNIYGMLWRCTVCQDAVLCPLCYVLDKHHTKHAFERIDYEGGSGVQVKKRSISLKIRAMGIFPGAEVTRGKYWIWGDQDGGIGSCGQVLGFENVAPTSSRNLVRVKWTSKGTANSYRLGFEGNVDIQCVDETPGTYYYKEHLPVVDTTGDVSSSPAPPVSGRTVTSSSSSSLALSSRGPAGAVGWAGQAKGGADFGAGDKVAISVDEERLKQLQLDYGGFTAGMIDCIGKTGEVVSMAPNGAVHVKFKRLGYRLNPQTLTKVPVLKAGDIVMIRPDIEQVKALNKRVGWRPVMDETCGKVGKVVKIDDDGDVMVSFGRRVYMYAPACCIPAPDSRLDELLSLSNQSTGSGGSGSGSGVDGEMHQKLMKMLARLMSDTGEGEGLQTEMGQLFKAINLGDKEAVQSVCQAQPELIHQMHQGMTLLMVACHEAKRDIVNMLLDIGAPINAEGEKGNTALGAALEGKKEAIALLLLERGASPTQLNSKQRSPAHVAAYNNMADALREIAKKGADVNVKDEFGDAPLHDAIEKDNKEALDVLIEAPGLDLQVRNRKDFNMLQLACLRGNAYAVERILQRDKSHVDDLMKGDFNALMIAVTNDHVECARLLVVEGNATLNMHGSQGLTALHLACNEAYRRSVEVLLNSNADVNVVADDGNTPLHLAIGTKSTQLRKNPSERLEQLEHRSRVQIACMLMEKGALIDVKNKNGAEPLQCCRIETIRKGFQQFIKENPGLIKRKGGGAGQGLNVSSQKLHSALGTLLRSINLPCGRCQGQSDITLRPCGHKALCRECCLKVTECPVCHRYIEQRVAIRTSSSDGASGGQATKEQLQEVCKQS